MDRPTVAIQADLTPYRRALEDAGFHVIPLNDNALGIAQAIVVQGTDHNFLGIDDPETLAPVINAEGLTPQAVLAAVQTRAVIRH